MTRILLPTLLVFSFACTKEVQKEAPKEPVKEAPAAPEKAAEKSAELVKAGAAIGHENVISVGEAFTNAATLSGKSVRISGKIQNVCQQKGCWMELVGDKPEHHLRITAKDYGFFFPKTASGQTALVEGELAVSELSIEDAQHLENERERAPGEEAKKITAPVPEISVVAVGAEIAPKAG